MRSEAEQKINLLPQDAFSNLEFNFFTSTEEKNLGQINLEILFSEPLAKPVLVALQNMFSQVYSSENLEFLHTVYKLNSSSAPESTINKELNELCDKSFDTITIASPPKTPRNLLPNQVPESKIHKRSEGTIIEPLGKVNVGYYNREQINEIRAQRQIQLYDLDSKNQFDSILYNVFDLMKESIDASPELKKAVIKYYLEKHKPAPMEFEGAYCGFFRKSPEEKYVILINKSRKLIDELAEQIDSPSKSDKYLKDLIKTHQEITELEVDKPVSNSIDVADTLDNLIDLTKEALKSLKLDKEIIPQRKLS